MWISSGTVLSEIKDTSHWKKKNHGKICFFRFLGWLLCLFFLPLRFLSFSCKVVALADFFCFEMRFTLRSLGWHTSSVPNGDWGQYLWSGRQGWSLHFQRGGLDDVQLSEYHIAQPPWESLFQGAENEAPNIELQDQEEQCRILPCRGTVD